MSAQVPIRYTLPKKKIVRLWLLALSVVSACIPAGLAESSASKEVALRLEQYGEVIGGRTITVSKGGVKIVSTKGGLTIISRAPAWNVLLCNSKARLYWEMPRSQFTGDPNARLYANDQKGMLKAKWRMTGTDRVMKRDTIMYSMEPPPPGKREGVIGGNYWVDSTAVVSNEGYEVLGKVLFLPPIVGVPLRLRWRDFDDGNIDALETGRLETIMVSDADYSCPKGFKKAKSREEVFVDPTSQATFDALRHFVDK